MRLFRDEAPRMVGLREVAPWWPIIHLPVRSGMGHPSAARLSRLQHIDLGRRELLRTAPRGLLPLLALSRGLSAERVGSRPMKAPMDEAMPWDSTAEVARRDFLRKTWEVLRRPHASASASSDLTLSPLLAPRADGVPPLRASEGCSAPKSLSHQARLRLTTFAFYRI